MRLALSALFLTAMTGLAGGADIESAYTEFDVEKDCATFAVPAEGEEGDWANVVCPGWRGYPVLVYYGDLRESVFYGFPPAGDMAPPWESFAGFNHTGPTIEWRILTEGRRQRPIATIHRWFVADAEETEKDIEVLVVEKVGQLQEHDGCVMGYVMATGNADANEKARRIADEQAFDFACGADQPVIDAGTIPLPTPAGGE
ncbi:hypothetical protein [Nitratireductor soli]|uniref:hypothetical protein n=1 Tax=Nitratireductor soli TaxID=1670619 RepID=UPI00065E4038|nr:hypothetical protein [Nitratireductor soli]